MAIELPWPRDTGYSFQQNSSAGHWIGIILGYNLIRYRVKVWISDVSSWVLCLSVPEGLLCLPNDWCHKSRRWQHITIMNSPNGSLTEPMMVSPRVWVVCFFQKPSEKELAPVDISKKNSIPVIMMFWPYQLTQDFVHQDYHESIKNKLANEVRAPLEPPNERSYFIRHGLQNGKTPTFRTWILRSL